MGSLTQRNHGNEIRNFYKKYTYIPLNMECFNSAIQLSGYSQYQEVDNSNLNNNVVLLLGGITLT